MERQIPTGDCPRCHMPIAEGSGPTTRDGVTYCCSGCANGSRCTCPNHAH